MSANGVFLFFLIIHFVSSSVQYAVDHTLMKTVDHFFVSTALGYRIKL